jgi:hypothetical protein
MRAVHAIGQRVPARVDLRRSPCYVGRHAAALTEALRELSPWLLTVD